LPAKEISPLLKEILNPLKIAAICAIATAILQIARPIARNELYRNLIYWRADISNIILHNHTLSIFTVVNESCYETDADISFSFQIYKDRNAVIAFNEEQKNGTKYPTDVNIPYKQMQASIREIFLGSPEDKTAFTLQPDIDVDNEGLQTITAKSSARLGINESACIAVVLWDFPSKPSIQEHKLSIGGRICKSYPEYIIYKDYLNLIKKGFYIASSAILVVFILAAAMICIKAYSYNKSKDRRQQEQKLEKIIH
jgi:hypothetical protein